MAITSIKTGSSFTNLQKYNDFLGPNAAFFPSSYESIATVTGTGSAGSITFSSIPSTYKHLQIRAIAKDTNTAGNTTLSVEMRFNGDTGSNYAYHELRGDGSTASTNAASSQTKIVVFNASLRETVATSSMGVSIIDVHDYSSTTKNKTVRYISGVNKNLGTTDDRISLGSGLWINTAAITSVTLIPTQTAFSTSTVFSLYGIKGA
jgi:hypothetical protein